MNRDGVEDAVQTMSGVDLEASGSGSPVGRTRRRRLLLAPLAALAASVLVLASCSSSSTAGSTTTTARPTTTGGGSGSSGTTVKTVDNPTLGTILVDANGATLYRFQLDHPGVATCTGSCASLWPPLTVGASEQPTGGSGVTGLGVVNGSGGTRQVSYQGFPLYRYSGDRAPGQTNGNGVGGVWSVVKVSSGSTPTGSTSSGATSSGSTGSTSSGSTGSSGSSGGSGY